ncbi:hypothetical protein ACFQJ5_11490 [Halomicroarcula sp. GCM10025324]|uniref:DUF7344 domain-containing protein n=1 Tax=Haloarcula TaxID=2237 RepID=UPI0023E815D4|nr:hypothetical protein [Halomicroarcula sp. ZS-22-S1]
MIGSDPAVITRDAAYEVLSNPRRRAILHILRTADRPIEVTTLAAQVAGWEEGIRPADLTSRQRKRVYVSMYQTHIPKLESVGLVTHEGENVRATNQIHEIDTYLSKESRWIPWYYLTTATSGFAVALFGLAALAPFVSTSLAYFAAFLLVASVGVSAVGQFIEHRQQSRTLPVELSGYPPSLRVTGSE